MIRPIAVEELANLLRGGLRDAAVAGGRVHIFDVRDAAAFEAGHIPGARHLPHDDVIRWAPQRASTLELVVVVDEDGAAEGPARTATAELAHRWFTRLAYLAAGMSAWRAAGEPLEQGGPAGGGADAYDGVRDEFQRSKPVPWATPEVPVRVV